MFYMFFFSPTIYAHDFNETCSTPTIPHFYTSLRYILKIPQFYIVEYLTFFDNPPNFSMTYFKGLVHLFINEILEFKFYRSSIPSTASAITSVLSTPALILYITKNMLYPTFVPIWVHIKMHPTVI